MVVGRIDAHKRKRTVVAAAAQPSPPGKVVGDSADVRRFRSRHGYARRNRTAPLRVWSGAGQPRIGCPLARVALRGNADGQIRSARDRHLPARR